jgi:predicted AlkP superfamily pyrophosphatase or phosphodiesterase
MPGKTTTIGVVAFLLAASGARADRRALILSIDGCRPDALAIAGTPNVDALAAAGSASFDARNSMVQGSSGPNYSSMFTGVTVAKHGVTSNSNDAGGFVGNHFDVWPHYFKRLKEHDPSLYLASYVGWGPINPGTWTDQYADVTGSSGDSGNTTAIVNLLTNGDPDLVFLQLSGVDSAGHGGAGFSPTNPAYLSAIEQADTRYGQILAALFARPGYLDGSEEWLIITTTDHGGQGTQHTLPDGGWEVYTTFYIVTGPTVPVGADLGTPFIYDVPVTAMDHFGLSADGMGLDGQVVIPEPATLSIFALAAGLAVLRRRRP